MATDRPFLRALLDLIAPEACVGCDEPADAPLCAACEPAAMGWPTRLCAGCGGRMGSPLHAVCARCMEIGAGALTPTHVSWVYHGVICEAVRAAKLTRALHRAWGLSRLALMRPPPPSFTARVDVLVPVPPTPARVARIGHDAARELSEGVARAAGWTLEPRVLRRRPMPSQTRRDPVARRLIAPTLYEPGRRVLSMAGAHVILMDDVRTTGSTLRACADLLRRAGAASVAAWVLAGVAESW